jgi:HTH-type transcriptional regulator, sugar sensing transcriptional regulator
MQDQLQTLGLSKEEAKVYIALLELGTAVASTVAMKAKVPRVNCYHTLDNLIKKGLVTSYTQNKIKRFTAENPQILANQQQENINRAQQVIPQLLSITNSLAYKPKIHFFEGLEGIKSIYNEAAETEDELLGYTDLKALPQLFPDFLKEHCKEKVQNKVKTRIISPSSPEARSFLQDYYPKNFDHNLIEIFFVNPEEFQFQNDIMIYENKVAIASLNPDELIGIIIESPVYAKTEKSIFGLAWLGATAFVAR